MGLVVAGEAAVVHEPAEGPLDNPPSRDDFEALLAGVTPHDFDVDAEGGAVVDGLGAVAGVGPGLGDAGVGVGVFESRWMPPALSETLAAVTQTARSRPSVSTPRWRLRPAIFLPPVSMPWPVAGTFAEVLMLWASSTQALGSGSRLSASRTSRRRRPLSWSNTPSFCQAAK